jgi:hypothetical protein
VAQTGALGCEVAYGAVRLASGERIRHKVELLRKVVTLTKTNANWSVRTGQGELGNRRPRFESSSPLRFAVERQRDYFCEAQCLGVAPVGDAELSVSG